MSVGFWVSRRKEKELEGKVEAKLLRYVREQSQAAGANGGVLGLRAGRRGFLLPVQDGRFSLMSCD